jgi:FAD/FMN-containing dehydrogenase
VAIVDELRTIVGHSQVLVDADQRASFEVDWTGRYRGVCAAVVRPGSTEEVAGVARACGALGVAIVPQGGNTGLVGGSVPRSATDGSTDPDRPVVVLSLTRLDHLGPVDAASMQVTAGAGVTLSRWRAHAHVAGLDAPLDFAARDTATIGGAIATNAGGSRVLRFGTMRNQVVGVEAVLASGEVVGSLAGLPKETAGMHWPSLVAGSEGTLAIVTAARLRLVPRFEHTVTAMVAMSSIAGAVDLLGHLRRSVPSLDAVEFVQPAALGLVADHLDRRPPVTVPADGTCLVVDCADHHDPTSQLADALGAPGVTDAVVTTDAAQRRELIEFRDRISEAIALAATASGTPTFKLDVAVPLGSLADVLTVAQSAADDDGARLIPFGHLAEGNAHLNFLDTSDTARVADTVLRAVAQRGGTISAEHGIGVAKAPWLDLIRSSADLAAQRAVKHALDPDRILNPGVLGR